MPMKVDNYHFESKLLPLLRRLEEAQATDAVAERKVKLFGGLGCGVGLLAVVTFFVLVDSGVSLLSFAFPFALAVAAFYFLAKMGKHMDYDLDNRKLACAVGLLRMLRADTPTQADVVLDLDLREYGKGGEQVESRNEGSVSIERFRHPWLSLRGVLADGTRYQLSVAETVDKKEKPKRKQNKVKERTRGEVQLQLRPKPDRYGEPSAIVAAMKTTAPKPPLQLKKLRAAGPRIVAGFVTGQHVKISARRGSGEHGQENLVERDALLSALLWAWDGLGRSARES